MMRTVCAVAAVVTVVGNSARAQAVGRWILIAGVVSADTADTIWAAKSTHHSAGSHTRIWIRHLNTIPGSSLDAQMEFDLNCRAGTTALIARHVQINARNGVQPSSGDMPIPPEARTPSKPVPGTLPAVAYRWGCAWLENAASKSRGADERGAPSGQIDTTWYAFPVPESPDTMFVDWTHAHRKGASGLVSVWVKFTVHGDSMNMDGMRAAYILAEFRIRCGQGSYRSAIVQARTFDYRDVLLAADDTPDAPLHAVADTSRESAVARLVCARAGNR